MTTPEPADRVLARAPLADGDPTGWFEHLCTAAARGAAVVPWTRGRPDAELAARVRPGDGRRALVVGSALGDAAGVRPGCGDHHHPGDARGFRSAALTALAGFLAPGGTLLVSEAAEENVSVEPGPPWPFSRAEIESAARDDVRVLSLETVRDGSRYWAAFTR